LPEVGIGEQGDRAVQHNVARPDKVSAD
jgi:hypothetical protein